MTWDHRSKTTTMEMDQIKSILPHRYPMLLIDRVIKISRTDHPQLLGTKLLAQKAVTINEPFFQGHFPERPVLPGIYMVEMMAQAGALAAYQEEIHKQNYDVVLASIRSMRFRKIVTPGHLLTIEVEILKTLKGITQLSGKISDETGDIVAEGEFLASFIPESETTNEP